MSTKLLYFSDAKQVSSELAKKCRNLSYRENGALASEFSAARKGDFPAKVAILLDVDTQTVFGWGAYLDYHTKAEIMVYVRVKCRRKGYGTKIVNRLISASNRHNKRNKSRTVYQPEHDPCNDFYLKKVNNPCLECV